MVIKDVITQRFRGKNYSLVESLLFSFIPS